MKQTNELDHSNFKVLIVDDIEENLQVLGNILSQKNLIISLAKSGRQAIKIAAVKQPDLILLDINMPEMNGYETCEILKKDKKSKHIPIIFLSANDEKENIVKGFEYGGVDYITKPFNKAELISRIFTHLELKKSKDIITLQNQKLKEKNIEVEKYHRNITDSIDYATRIQSAILPDPALLKKKFDDHFVIFFPKDKVSGDFYWWSEIKEFTVITAADCTGHGVPGAFMSMLGISFLREIVNKEYFTNTSVILRRLRKEIINTLKENSQDGMDMALVSINHKTGILQFSGANNPMYLIRKGPLDTTDKKIIELKCKEELNPDYKFYEFEPNRMPISNYIKMDRFSATEIEVKKGDYLYLFSDGYSDQFGGKYNRKFMTNRFRKIIFENVNQPMIVQREILESTFKKWKGNNKQLDDVVVIGIKV